MPLDKNLIENMNSTGREIYVADQGDEYLGALRWLPGTWENTSELKGHGFNMIALPFISDPNNPRENGYRLLMNQYEEILSFELVDKGVPNRGSKSVRDPATGQIVTLQDDQTVVALTYEQVVTQIDFEDSYLENFSGTTSKLSKTNISAVFNKNPIHHEPGLWLHMTDKNIFRDNGVELSIARMGSIPHGNSFTAVGSSREIKWEQIPADQKPNLIPNINGVVVGGGSDPDERALDPLFNPNTGDIDIDYFAPYRYFHNNPFKGSVNIDGFSGFEPVDTTLLLRNSFEKILDKIGTIKNVTRLHVDSTIDHAGINRVANPSIGNTPFITRQSDATAMNCTFIIYEIEDSSTGNLRYFLQYAQNVILDFIGRPDGHPGRARWPHVSINTLERVSGASPKAIMKAFSSRPE
ncbi:heme-binding protein [Asticcacaulis sp. AC460]|uniref:heme-binding protein n=1 Tax=Asticcacaulis sp. AC460 TaxID=1282360 RepID=UPI00041B466A|nr:heme-binding protein [Asticcacaulis sp. AC460]